MRNFDDGVLNRLMALLLQFVNLERVRQKACGTNSFKHELHLGFLGWWHRPGVNDNTLETFRPINLTLRHCCRCKLLQNVCWNLGCRSFIVPQALEQTSASVHSVSERCSQDLCAGSGAGSLAFCTCCGIKACRPFRALRSLHVKFCPSRSRGFVHDSCSEAWIEVQGLYAAKRFAAAATLVVRVPIESHCVGIIPDSGCTPPLEFATLIGLPGSCSGKGMELEPNLLL